MDEAEKQEKKSQPLLIRLGLWALTIITAAVGGHYQPWIDHQQKPSDEPGFFEQSTLRQMDRRIFSAEKRIDRTEEFIPVLSKDIAEIRGDIKIILLRLPRLKDGEVAGATRTSLLNKN